MQVLHASAEAMSVPGGSAALITACTAFHWFDRGPFFAEAARVLAPGRMLAILRNRRIPSPVVAAFDAYIQEMSIEVGDHLQSERGKEPSVRELQAPSDFRRARSRTYTWSSETNCRGLIDLYLTRSTLTGVVRRPGLGRVMVDLSVLFARHSPKGSRFRVDWETTVKWLRRK